jgi:benzylsuccinate CoA-transferase BbsF subunit
MTINMNHPSGKGIELAKKLIKWADVLVENFTPGMMERWGLGYEAVKEIKPDIIMVRMSQLGQTGPLSHLPGTGNQLVSLSGFTYLTGYPDRDPSNLYGGFTDTGSARLTAVALLAALCYRKRTGKGQLIDASQYESGGVHFLAPMIMGYTANGDIPIRNGNRCSMAAPHNTYRCLGEERWCAITVFTDAEWQGLCRAMGNDSLARNPKFSTLEARKNNEEELDAIINRWTSGLTREETVVKLQHERVPAGIVEDSRDLYNDPQLAHQGYFQEVDHPVIGKHWYEAQPFKFSNSPFKLRMRAPLLGEHNKYVCAEILGMSDEEFVDLLVEGVFE